jgi:ceramide glucosyltransferase
MEYVFYLILAVFLASLGYLLTATFCVLKFRRRLKKEGVRPTERPGVTLYKPLHGLDVGLLQNLRSFCQQDYPEFQIIFGVSDAGDPAIEVVRQVLSEYPDINAELVINTRSNGLNPKVSNLINMNAVAIYDVLVISDSDMRVGPDYLDRVLAGFETEEVGLVTCLYKGTPAPGLPSSLGAMFITEWFTPSALIPASFGEMQHCFGATMAVKRETLEKIGGFNALVGNLADDYTLGKLVRIAGLKIHLADEAVENIVEEDSLKSLILHELRWARTIRSVEPLGFLSTFLTDALPLSLMAGVAAYFADFGWFWVVGPAVVAVFVRILLHFSTKNTFSSKYFPSLWIIPLRDMLSFVVRLLCYTGRTVSWRNSELSVGKDGQINTLDTRRRVVKSYEKNPVSESPLL